MLQEPSHIILFNDARYRQYNLRTGQRLFRYDHVNDGRLVGTFSGVVENDELICGYSAPFGGIDLTRSNELVGTVVGLVQAATASARADGIRKITIRARPAYYGANEVSLEFALLNFGATIEVCELSLGLEVRRYRTPGDYVATLRPSAAQQLRQGIAAGMNFSAVETPAEWSEAFALLVEARRRRGAVLKISLEYVMGLRNIFGPRIAMYTLRRDDHLAAAALVYRVGEDLEYLVSWGDDLRDRKDRAMNVMAYHLVRTALSHGVAVFDLGISSVDGVPDDGLTQFKRHIGGTTGLRIDFRLDLD